MSKFKKTKKNYNFPVHFACSAFTGINSTDMINYFENQTLNSCLAGETKVNVPRSWNGVRGEVSTLEGYHDSRILLLYLALPEHKLCGAFCLWAASLVLRTYSTSIGSNVNIDNWTAMQDEGIWQEFRKSFSYILESQILIPKLCLLYSQSVSKF